MIFYEEKDCRRAPNQSQKAGNKKTLADEFARSELKKVSRARGKKAGLPVKQNI